MRLRSSIDVLKLSQGPWGQLGARHEQTTSSWLLGSDSSLTLLSAEAGASYTCPLSQDGLRSSLAGGKGMDPVAGGQHLGTLT